MVYQVVYRPSSPVGYIGSVILGKRFHNIYNFRDTARK